jgi:uncharacterized membrane protein YeiB
MPDWRAKREPRHLRAQALAFRRRRLSKAPMPARRPNLSNAAFELGFTAAAFVCGLIGAPYWAAGIVAFAMLAFWSWTRRVALNKLKLGQWALRSLISVAVIIAVLALAYGAGLAIHGAIA